MSRIESKPTWELWGMSKEFWIYHLKTTGKFKLLVEYYESGISMMEAMNRDTIGTNKYKDIVGTDIEKTMFKRQKTISFYRKRLSELKETK